MASIQRRRGSKLWTAYFRDQNKRLHCRSTGVQERKQAQQIADAYEAASRNTRAKRQLTRVLCDMYRLVGEPQTTTPVLTVREHISAWLGTKTNETKTSTLAFSRSSTGKLLSFLGSRAEVPLLSITKVDLTAYRDQLAITLSARTTTHHMAVVGMLFRSALADALLADDPSAFIKSVKKEKAASARRAFTLPELQSLLSVADNEWRSMILFGLYSGQRLMDIAQLRWNNLDLVRNEIRLETGKTGKVLILPIAEPLRRHIETLTVTDDPRAPIHPRAFAAKRVSVLSNQFAGILVAAGLRTDCSEVKLKGRRRRVFELGYHCLRHTATSFLHEAGIPEAVTQAYIGHSSESSHKLYVHVGLTALQQAAGALPDLS
jgi:integrase